ncbi:hypothetical protein [Bradyrhizobium sp. AZCC 2230]|uniref:hypothetical protein n=1 Tax=Bradyrhizobium sp. AZCC 2230 TaxID=3117021 RepID=UPI002FF0D3D8
MMAATEIYHKGRTHAEHCAWLEALTGDEYRIVHMPIGHQFSIALVSVFKHALLTLEMTAGQRMKFLDGIASVIDGSVTAEAVAAIAPADPVGLKMMQEITRLPVERKRLAGTLASGSG